MTPRVACLVCGVSLFSFAAGVAAVFAGSYAWLDRRFLMGTKW